jgi:hypothetical protein
MGLYAWRNDPQSSTMIKQQCMVRPATARGTTAEREDKSVPMYSVDWDNDIGRGGKGVEERVQRNGDPFSGFLTRSTTS